jgi:hypothetical protein
MDQFEIGIIVLCIVVILMILACAVDSYITTRCYKKFYETTEDGKKLYYARYMLDLLKIKKCSFIRNQMQLKDKIDEYTAYMPDDNENGENLIKLKLQYKCNIEELKRINQKIEDLEKQIKKMVADLPKKYKGILDYNWEIAKVEVKEEDICW